MTKKRTDIEKTSQPTPSRPRRSRPHHSRPPADRPPAEDLATALRREERAEVAWHLGALIRDPATPPDLYNLLLSWIGERETAYLNSLRGGLRGGLDYADHLLRMLNWHASERRKA